MLKSVSVSAIALTAGLAALALPAQADHRPDTYSGRGYGQAGGVVLYADAGFSGDGLEVNGAVPDLVRLRFNDRASSIEIRNGAWEVCVDANFRGRCEVITASSGRLGTYRLNDNISSLRPAGYGHDGYSRDGYGGDRRPGRGGEIVLYADAGLRGQAARIGYDVASLSDWKFNDRASSFQVTGGSWQVCEHANYQGHCEILTAGAGDLKPIRMNDNISSIRRIDGRGYGR